mmetsp:Transcript_48681/g.35840  ORF Transcript_48681/g.35840 Transcript_48681/m.35840 type:complete len:105 (+) Transcript_48681:1268-1582(+)
MVASSELKSKKKDNCINHMILLQSNREIACATDAGIWVGEISDKSVTFSNEVYLADHSATSVLEYDNNKLCVPISHESLDYVCLIDRKAKSQKMLKHGKKTWTS